MLQQTKKSPMRRQRSILTIRSVLKTLWCAHLQRTCWFSSLRSTAHPAKASCNRSLSLSRRPIKTQARPSSKSSSSIATAPRSNTRSTWPRWTQRGSQCPSRRKAYQKGLKIWHRLRTSPAWPSSTPVSQSKNARFRTLNQSSFEIRAVSKL